MSSERVQARAMKPVLFVTGHAPPDRVGAFALLNDKENVEFALFGGRSLHGPDANDTGAANEPGPPRNPDTSCACAADDLPFPHRHIHQHQAGRLAAGGGYRAVVCSTGGRVALPATWAGARRAKRPLILWSALWAHPRSAAHLLSWPALHRLYRSADAIVTYGPHVSAYVRARGARNVHVAPQSVDNAFWSAPVEGPPADPRWPRGAQTKFMFAGRPDREKGIRALIEAWRESGLAASAAALVLVGVGSSPPWVPADGAAGITSMSFIPPVSAQQLRAMYADADVLVVPSIRTRTFREPWGLVINEAMNRGLAVIASDEVGAVAGGLVSDGHNGVVVPAGDTLALARAMARLAADPRLRARLGATGARDVRAYTHEAWASGFSQALASVGLSRTHW
jgi:glycosyltransferase involved in cell wall biosynthesis